MIMNNNIDLFLLRHGQTDWNLENRVQGRLDSNLSALGIRQAINQRKILLNNKHIKTRNIICSPTGRARQTAEIINHHDAFSVQFDSRLMEIDVGDWEGLKIAAIKQKHPEKFTGKFTFLSLYSTAPNGEGLDQLRARCLQFLSGIDAPTIIISHGVFLTMMRGILLNLDYSEMEQWSQPQGVVSHIKNGRETLLL